MVLTRLTEGILMAINTVRLSLLQISFFFYELIWGSFAKVCPSTCFLSHCYLSSKSPLVLCCVPPHVSQCSVSLVYESSGLLALQLSFVSCIWVQINDCIQILPPTQLLHVQFDLRWPGKVTKLHISFFLLI